ncbi:MAG: hypothetical protein M1579_02105 [Gammaproteobacteria bacterium]|nr:hypothetical protein [Gammaproteobacteria bacterium]
MNISIFDQGDGCTYTLNISEDDALSVYNMKNFGKASINLPSIGGNASISGNDVTIMYKNGASLLGSIYVPLDRLQKIIDEALKANQE